MSNIDKEQKASEFKYAHLLKFLDNVDSFSGDNDSMTSEAETESIKSEKCRHIPEEIQKIMRTATKLIEMDDYDHLGGLVATTLRKLPKKKRLAAKKKIFIMLMEFEEEN